MVSIPINKSKSNWQSWWNFAMKIVSKCLFLGAQMFIYRHLTRTTLIRTFQRTQFIGVITLHIHSYTGCILCSVPRNWYFENYFSYTWKLIALHISSRDEINYNTFCYMGRKLSFVQHKRKPISNSLMGNDFCKSFCIRNSHITRTTQVYWTTERGC